MPALQTIYDNVRVLKHKGCYALQLEIPPESTLTERDIEMITSLASWQRNPADEKYEGGRSIVIPKDNPIQRGPIIFSGLQISGIGYVPLQSVQVGIAREKEHIFHPPSQQDFRDIFSNPSIYGTTVAKNGQLHNLPSGYSPLGTYKYSELLRKVAGTRTAAQLPLEKIMTPALEAWGFFQEPSLSSEEGPFGFMVTAVPNVNKLRIFEELKAKVKEHRPLSDAGIFCYEELIRISKRCLPGLRELHTRGYAHLQPHTSNWYLIDEMPVLTDWDTLVSLNGTEEDNIAHQIIDFAQFAQHIIGTFEYLCYEKNKRVSYEVELGLVLNMALGYNGENALEILFEEFQKRKDIRPLEYSDAFHMWMREIINQE